MKQQMVANVCLSTSSFAKNMSGLCMRACVHLTNPAITTIDGALKLVLSIGCSLIPRLDDVTYHISNQVIVDCLPQKQEFAVRLDSSQRILPTKITSGKVRKCLLVEIDVISLLGRHKVVVSQLFQLEIDATSWIRYVSVRRGTCARWLYCIGFV